jgi:2,4-dienoyl-CoA reductase (NADPH2)
MLGGVQYLRIDDEGLHVTVKGEPRVIACDTVVVCAEQQSRTDLSEGLERKRVPMTVIGGARLAAELDAMRAIDDGVRLAVRL